MSRAHTSHWALLLASGRSSPLSASRHVSRKLVYSCPNKQSNYVKLINLSKFRGFQKYPPSFLPLAPRRCTADASQMDHALLQSGPDTDGSRKRQESKTTQFSESGTSSHHKSPSDGTCIPLDPLMSDANEEPSLQSEKAQCRLGRSTTS